MGRVDLASHGTKGGYAMEVEPAFGMPVGVCTVVALFCVSLTYPIRAGRVCLYALTRKLIGSRTVLKPCHCLQ
jgi:hypothetical protein